MSKEIAFYKGKENEDAFRYAESLFSEFGDEYRLYSDDSLENCKGAGALLFCGENAFCLAKSLRLHTVARLYSQDIFIDAYGQRKESGIKRGNSGREAYDLIRYPELEIEKTARTAFEWAEKYNKSMIAVDCADMLETGKLWRYVVQDVAQDYLNVPIRYAFLSDYLRKGQAENNIEDIVLTNSLVGGIISQAFFAEEKLSGETICLFGDTTFAAYGREKQPLCREGIKESILWAIRESFNCPDQAEWLLNKQ